MPNNKPKLMIYFFDKNIPLILYGQHFYHIFATQAAQADQSWFPFAIAVGTVVLTCSYIFSHQKHIHISGNTFICILVDRQMRRMIPFSCLSQI